MNDREIFGKLSELAEQGIPLCLATIVETAGSTPREVGAKMLVGADGWTFGSVGGGCGEHQVKSAALRCLVVSGQPELLEVDLTDDLGTRGGDVCGGKMWIFVEKIDDRREASKERPSPPVAFTRVSAAGCVVDG